MGCNCRLTNAVLAVVVLVFTFWNSFAAAKWLAALAAVLLLIHSLWCHNCRAECEVSKPSKKRRR